MKTKWTPGPWHVATYGEGPKSFLAIKHGSRTVAKLATVPYLDSEPGSPEKDAHLIAWAPELAAALRELLKTCSNHHWRVNSDEYDSIADARALLAKLEE